MLTMNGEGLFPAKIGRGRCFFAGIGAAAELAKSDAPVLPFSELFRHAPVRRIPAAANHAQRMQNLKFGITLNGSVYQLSD